MTGAYDVAVLGSGPAGAACAALLAKAGASVTLLERPARPPDGVELLSGRARGALADLGLGVPGAAVVETLARWRGAPTRVSTALASPWGAGLAVVRRALDDTLRAYAVAAGATPSHVLSVGRVGGGWRVATAAHGVAIADFLVIATGRCGSAPVDRSRPDRASHVAVLAQVPDVDRGASLLVETSAHGWWYVLPDPRRGRFVAWCAETRRLRGRAVPVARLWRRELGQTRLTKAALRGSAPRGPLVCRPAGAARSDPAAGNGWLAVGDAGFATDVLSGQGLEFALLSARAGAVAVAAEDRTAAVRAYATWLADVAASHLRMREEWTGFRV
ncbi:MAG TPA: NAD(P)-binding protein [Thermoleophilaceae bacterium]|nr:NAD(P)-binding protein [Thermoleophilaceae bacterium]